MTTAIASNKRSKTSCRWAFAAGAVLCACIPTSSFADEGGVSFWLPGLFGSLAATPLQPGLTFSSTYYHTSVTGEGDVSRAREITVGRFPINFSGSANLQLNSAANLGIFNAIYTLPTPVLGGQAAIALMGLFGRVNTSLYRNTQRRAARPGRDASSILALRQYKRRRIRDWRSVSATFRCAGTLAFTTS